jgi:tyrosyl-tRNA synthetase
MMQKNIEEQLFLLSSGTAEILPESGLKEKLAEAIRSNKPLIVKLGVDPTAPDLHLGHSVPLRKLRQFQDLGHQVILIIGDFTAAIGDPSGRSKTRPSLTPEQVKKNADTYTNQAFKILDEGKTKIVYNSQWLSRLSLIEVVKLMSRFTVAGLLVRDDFEKRYRNGQVIGLHEFLYPVMQAYDSVKLKADVEIGGTDQKFNLLAGRQLQERMGLSPQVCLTLPLLEGTDGHLKMSKSYNNHIGIAFEPWDMFGKVMSIPDELIVKYFRLVTLVSRQEVDEIEKGLFEGMLHPGETKRRLAREIVKIYHGRKAAKEAEEDFDSRFVASKRGSVDVSQEKYIPANQLKDGCIYLPKLLATIGFAKSNGEARRLIAQGGVRIEGKRILDPNAEVKISNGILVQVGKRRIARLQIE